MFWCCWSELHMFELYKVWNLIFGFVLEMFSSFFPTSFRRTSSVLVENGRHLVTASLGAGINLSLFHGIPYHGSKTHSIN